MVQMELLSVQVYSHVKLPIQKKLKVSIKEKKTLFPIVFQSECSKITKRNLINYHNIFFSFLPSSPLLNWFIIIPCNTTSSYKCWFLIFDKKKKSISFHFSAVLLSPDPELFTVHLIVLSLCFAWRIYSWQQKKVFADIDFPNCWSKSFIQCGSPKESKVTTLKLGLNSPFTCKRLLQTLHLLFISQYSERPKCLSIITCFSQNDNAFFLFF